MDARPDLVVSGINNGANMGDDTLYSGTVAAASEGYLFGIPAIAFSLAEKGWAHIESAARAARLVVERHLAQPLAAPVLLNVNIPSRRFEDMHGFAVTRLGKRHPSQPVVRTTTPYGDTVYWIGPVGLAADAAPGTDFHAVEQGTVSVTPLRLDLNRSSQPRRDPCVGGAAMRKRVSQSDGAGWPCPDAAAPSATSRAGSAPASRRPTATPASPRPRCSARPRRRRPRPAATWA